MLKNCVVKLALIFVRHRIFQPRLASRPTISRARLCRRLVSGLNHRRNESPPFFRVVCPAAKPALRFFVRLSDGYPFTIVIPSVICQRQPVCLIYLRGDWGIYIIPRVHVFQEGKVGDYQSMNMDAARARAHVFLSICIA